MLYTITHAGKLPIDLDDTDAQKVPALELPHAKEEGISDFNNHHQNEALPPLPPKPLAG